MKMGLRAMQYSLRLSDEEMDSLVEVPPQTINLTGVDVQVGLGLLEAGLTRVVVSDSQTRELLRLLIARAQAHATSNLDTDSNFLTSLYSKNPWGLSRRPAICLTGLQGVGKTGVLNALGRILMRQPSTFSVAGHQNIPLVPLWMMTLARGDGLNELLRKFIDPLWGIDDPDAKGKSSKNWSIPKLLSVAQRRSWLNATCLSVVDEFQWVTASADANARAASVLLKLHGIGPLLVYCANFSLGHKLMARPPEEIDRLMCRPLIIKPFEPDSLDFTHYLEALQKVAPSIFKLDPKRDLEQIHRYTFGIRRKIVDLLVSAYQISNRRGGSGKVGAQELLLAFRSELYAMHRDQVEVLFRQQITKKMEHKDLWCPFGSTDPERSNVHEAEKIIQAFERRTEDALLKAALTSSESAAAAVINPNTPNSSSPAKVVRFRRTRVTKDSLLAGAAALDGNPPNFHRP